MSTMHVEIITPEGTAFSGEATFLVGRATDGEFGILPHHAPLVAALDVGIIRIDGEKETHQFHVSGGFIEVENNSIYITTTALEEV